MIVDLNAFIMEQVLAHIIWLLIQCLYYEAGTGSYTMFVLLRPGASKSVSLLKKPVRVYIVQTKCSILLDMSHMS
jgi:hypothetical protein